MRLEGKVAIVTGGAGSLGAADARLLAKEGARVVIADIIDGKGQEIATEIINAGGEALYLHLDVTSEADWQSIVDETIKRYGTIDTLVNNAGIPSSSVSDPMDLDGWRRIMDVNATSVYLGTRAVIPVMQKARQGSIINMSSIMGFVGGAGGHPAYGASKGAVRIFTKATAVKYGPDGIRANSIHPGYMPPMSGGKTPPDSVQEERIRLTPLQRNGEATEVAYGVLFLASDESSFVTGTELVIDGGFLAR